MNYRIETNKKVKKFLDKCDIHIASQFMQKAALLEKDPYDKTLDINKLQGEENSYRLRIGKYRFLYTIKEEKILIYFWDADSRGDIYK